MSDRQCQMTLVVGLGKPRRCRREAVDVHTYICVHEHKAETALCETHSDEWHERMVICPDCAAAGETVYVAKPPIVRSIADA